ncbi:Bifunctional F420 biosynthesis protein FbiB [subsurface metagenome]|jgi:nitroreductase
MDVIDAIHGRRSVRSYDSRPVPRELIESLITDAAQAPPPFRDMTPCAFNVIEGVERIAAYGERAMQYAREHRPTGPESNWVERPDFKVFWDAPVVVIISGPVGDCNRAGQNFMLSAHARGLGSCWVGSPMLWLSTPEVRAELKIPCDLAPVAVLCLGYPANIPEAIVRTPPPIAWV